jgi:apolipoprotein N-acyltransferase
MKGLSMNRKLLLDAALALAGGSRLALEHSACSPCGGWPGLAPAPVLLAALRSTRAHVAFLLTAAAALIEASGQFPLSFAGDAAAGGVLVMVLLALPWVLVVGLARRVMTRTLRHGRCWPIRCCGARGYPAGAPAPGHQLEQPGLFAGRLRCRRCRSSRWLGTAGLVFVLSLVPAVLALAAGARLARARSRRWHAGAGARMFHLRSCARIRHRSPQGRTGRHGRDRRLHRAARAGGAGGAHLVAVRAPCRQLAGQGARMVLLPEKIAVLAPDAAAADRTADVGAGRAAKVWLAPASASTTGPQANTGLAVRARRPPGRRLRQAPHGAAGTRLHAAGDAYDVQAIGGTRYGLAICKDMHFAAMGRDYGQRSGAQAMLVPAWDFGEDGEYAARLSALRGVESGFAMVRAAREGLLTISDAYGRVVARNPSAPLPGADAAGAPAGAGAVPATRCTARTGDLFGWLCTAAALLMLVLGWRAHVPPQTSAPVPPESLPARPFA